MSLQPTTEVAAKGVSTLPTPVLSASTSTEVSPAYSELVSPPLPADELLDIDAGADDSVASKESVPECWGHRGASATFPENTRASFVEAIKAGADGIETDIHITSDAQLVLFHDPELSRTTNGQGKIGDQPWYGVLEHVRTVKQPIQPIPMFKEVLDLLMTPGNMHVKLNMDCKVENEPERLFSLMKDIIESYPNWQTLLAPRIILGIWHPTFIAPAARILPFLPRYAISMSIPEARTYFFTHCQGLSIHFPALASADGQLLLQQCKEVGKRVCTWTVNDIEEMRECARWGVQSIISDKPALWQGLKKEILADRQKALRPTWASYIRPWMNQRYWMSHYGKLAREETEYLEKEAGKMKDVVVPDVSLKVAKPADVMA